MDAPEVIIVDGREVPFETVKAVVLAIHRQDCGCGGGSFIYGHPGKYERHGLAVLAVPAIADALRDAEALAKVREQFSDTDAHSAVVLQRIANITAGDHPEAFIAMDESARQQVRNLVGEWFDDFNLADDFLGMLHRSGFQITRIVDLLVKGEA